MKDDKSIKLMTAYLTHAGFEVWKKAGPGRERIYINNQALYELGFDNNKREEFKGVTMYYEINKDEFYYKDVKTSHIDALESFTQGLRDIADETRSI